MNSQTKANNRKGHHIHTIHTPTAMKDKIDTAHTHKDGSHEHLHFIKAPDGTRLAYNLWGAPDSEEKVLMIMGFVCCTRYWDMGEGPLGVLAAQKRAAELGRCDTPDTRPLHICTFDNRGSGSSGKPVGRYTTRDLAMDALHLLAHLRWIRFVVLSMIRRLEWE